MGTRSGSSEEDTVVDAVDVVLRLAGLDDECRDRVTDLIVAGLARRRPPRLLRVWMQHERDALLAELRLKVSDGFSGDAVAVYAGDIEEIFARRSADEQVDHARRGRGRDRG